MNKPDFFNKTVDDTLDGAPDALQAAPQRAYTDEAQFAAELERVFANDWVMIGRAGAIPEPGDYFTALMGKKPIIVMRQEDGSIRAMGNFCLHRYAKLLKGQGKSKRIVCPYHRWTYTMDGSLIGTPDRGGFAKEEVTDRRLSPLACEVHLGFIYVSARHDLPPVSERQSGLSALIENFDLGAYEDRHVVHEEVWEGNWKLLMENFIESAMLLAIDQDLFAPNFQQIQVIPLAAKIKNQMVAGGNKVGFQMRYDD